MRGVAALLLLTAAILSPRTARPDVLLHDGGVERDREAIELMRARVGTEPTTVLAGEVLSGPTRTLTANLTLERCHGAPAALQAAERLERIRDAVLSFDIGRSQHEIEGLRSVLTCAAEPVPVTTLAAFWFFQGASLLDQGQEDEGRVAMTRAILVDPAFAEPKGLPTAHSTLLAAVRAAPRPAMSRLFIWPGRVAGQVLVDGSGAEEPSAVGVSVPEGPHLLQIRLPDRVIGLWVTTSGLEAALVEPASGRAIWTDGGRSPGGELAMRLLLADEFHGSEGDVHVIQYRRGRPVGATWKASGGPLVPWEASAPVEEGPRAPPARTPREASKPKVRSTAPAPPSSRVRFVLGGGWAYAHPFHYAMIAVDLDIRLVGPLHLGIFGRPGYGGTFVYPVREGDPPLDGPLFFAPLGLSFGVAAPRDVSPFVRGAFQFAYNRDGLSAGQGLIGAALQGGVDLSPRGSHFLARLEAEVGLLGDRASGRAIFTGRVGGGVGARF